LQSARFEETFFFIRLTPLLWSNEQRILHFYEPSTGTIFFMHHAEH
jgi:hypothetical protein